MRTLWLVSALLLALPATASAGDDADHRLIAARLLRSSKRLCEVSWPKKKKPPRAMTDRCLQYWLFTYNYERPKSLAGVEEALSLDPIAMGGGRYTAASFRAMAAHVRAAFPGGSGWLVARALEFFDGSAATYTSFFDMNFDVEAGMRTILAGKPLRAHLEGAGPTTLWLLRNAVYARHGRKFKHPDLNHYFYGAWKRPAGVARLFPLRVDPRFSEKKLTRTDRETVRKIAAAEKKR